MLDIRSQTFGLAWVQLLGMLYNTGKRSKPRGMGIREHLGVRFHVEDALMNVLVCDIRNPNYRFMVAEWLWIWFGHDDVATIAQYNKKIADFSDNGVDFNGAYGKPIAAQWSHVRSTLLNDNDTRQAVIVIYKMPTQPTRDVPCTVSMQFLLRDNELNGIVTMRSSDIWLGLPYDFFNFSMLLNCMAAELDVNTGFLQMNLGSSHLYDTNEAQSFEITQRIFSPGTYRSPAFKNLPPVWLDNVLMTKSFSSATRAPLTDSPWVTYASVLVQEKNVDALDGLKILSDYARA